MQKLPPGTSKIDRLDGDFLWQQFYAVKNLGLDWAFIGMFDESVSELEDATRLDPNNVLARNDLALTYTMLGMYDKAKAEFARVLERDRENDIALRNLSYIP